MISRRSFVALQHRNFRLIWIGLFLSFTGSTMQNAALLWQVSLLVPSEQKGMALGMVGLVKVVPIIVFSLFAGVVADAWNRRRVLLFTQAGSALVALGLAWVTIAGVSSVWPIYALAALGAAVSAFDLPARHALIPMLVPREHLPNAISLNTTMVQMASVTGPALAGLLISGLGLFSTYLVNALSFGCVFAALVAMRNIRHVHGRESSQVGSHNDVSFGAALEGLRFVFRSPLIRSTMVLDFLATFFSSATALLPIFAQEILHVGARGYGLLYAAPAAGALLTSAVMVALIERIQRRGPTLLWAVAIHGLATVFFGLSRSMLLTFACLMLIGASDTVSMIIRNLIRQLETPDRLRGRMAGVNMVFFIGGPQLGEFEAGAVATWMGAVFSVVSGGVGCVAATAWIAARTPALRRYTSHAVLASGLEEQAIAKREAQSLQPTETQS
ncbi:MAG TPA: MFS transporter [Vicinamibacterales bacterium]|nr:MFS transporter [Vicinamibacterales bacterium]